MDDLFHTGLLVGLAAARSELTERLVLYARFVAELAHGGRKS